MNYGDLKTAVLDFAHRPDLSAQAPTFVRLAEGLIRRELRAFVTSTTLTESDRVSGGVYNLPSTLQEIRSLHRKGEDGDALERVSMHALRRRVETAPAVEYAERGDGTIEIRGTPGTDAEFDLVYLGHPATLVNDTDENDLLTNHEALYLYGALFYLYSFTQDVELSEGSFNTFNDTLRKVNEQFGRRIGGQSIAGGYNFQPCSSY